ncbi:MAG: hypothetical protein TU35_008415 [Thermoproteus sp. AZ2]|jgi:hypothetical protein|uniref:Uncharacterized protein n=1 Tax=Thermoproteus sp. AZ2 TaxID=1609232 RepID=A0ACC6V2R6_9CREN|nr:MAG: hypothetical protein TU35_09150 [Thermoproteus sp. AZ2]
MRLDAVIALIIAVLLAVAFTWISLLSHDKVLLGLAWLVVALVAFFGYFERRSEPSQEHV